MTDNEIIKALNTCCGENGCFGCPYTENHSCRLLRNPIKDALDLINRLQAENERLRNTLDDVLDRQPLLVERSEKYAKAEAYKEFAERLKEKKLYNYEWECNVVECDTIDNLLKELVGEDNGL